MTVLVRNETGGDWYFGAGSAKVIVSNGQIETISDNEWATVPTSKRGPGGLNCLWPTLTDSTEVKTEIEYYTTAATNQVHYIGTAPQDALTTDAVWTVKKYAHTDLGGGDVRVSEIQTLVNRKWSDRAVLPWT